MKKILYILCTVAAMLASCVKEETNDEQLTGKHQVTICALPDLSLADEPQMKMAQTRGTEICNRYVLELYSDANYNTRVGTQQLSTDGNFELALERTKTYYALIWADNNASAIYDVTTLKAVTLKTNQSPAEAFYGKLTLSENQTAYHVSLKRAVAKLTLKETKTLYKGSVTVKYNQKPTFNVVDNTTSGTAVSLTRTVSITADVTGTQENPVTLNANNPIYVLASATATTLDFICQYRYADESSPELEFTVTAPTQMNYNTNITGAFLVSDPKARAGYFYYKNRTWSKINKETIENPVIGIVCAVNPDGYSGKIISLDETKLAWSTSDLYDVKVPGTESTTDGPANTIAYSNYSATKFPCVTWCVAKNTPALAGIHWYVPAKDELMNLYSVRDKINTALGKCVNSTVITYDMPIYSSTQGAEDALQWHYKLSGQYTAGKGHKSTEYNTRAMSAFN